MPLTPRETVKAISQLSSGKTPGNKTIPAAEVYKSGGPVYITQKLVDIFQSMWAQGAISQDFKDASIVHLYKRKGNRRYCNNHLGDITSVHSWQTSCQSPPQPPHQFSTSNEDIYRRVSAAFVPQETVRDSEEGILIRYRTNGKLFDQRRLQAVIKVKEITIRDFLFADDRVLDATTEQKMQTSSDKLSGSCDSFGVTINTKKHRSHVPALSWKASHKTNITANGGVLNVMDKFTYRDSTLLRNATIDQEVDSRVAKASNAFGRLQRNVWGRWGISLKAKLKVYHDYLNIFTSMIWSVVEYACSVWHTALTKGQSDQLESVQSRVVYPDPSYRGALHAGSGAADSIPTSGGHQRCVLHSKTWWNPPVTELPTSGCKAAVWDMISG